MRQVFTKFVKPGDVLGTTVFSKQDRVLLHSGVVLTNKMITRLLELGINMIMIDDDISKDVIIEDLVSLERRQGAMVLLEASEESFKAGKGLNTFHLKEVVNDIVEDIIFKKHILSGIMDIRSNDNHMFAHAVNVCILAVVLGKSLKLEREKLDTLAVGAILHDVGAIMLPQSLLQKREPFSETELALFRTHTEEGYKILRSRRDISFVSAHIAYQHHEAFDGSGYPRGLIGEKFNLLAQIVALADFYDNLVNEGPGHGRVHPYEAVEILMARAEVLFSYELIKAFLKHIAVYPNGSTVELNSGDVGIVVSQNLSLPTRPVVRILPRSSVTRSTVNSDNTYDMIEHLTLFITKVTETNIVEGANENLQAQIAKTELQNKIQDNGEKGNDNTEIAAANANDAEKQGELAEYSADDANLQYKQAEEQRQEAKEQTIENNETLANENKNKANKETQITPQQRDNTLKSQSLFFAEISKQQLIKGNRMMAIKMALKALPKDLDNPDRPYVIEAEAALRNAINGNNVRAYISSSSIKHDKGVTSIAFSHDSSKVVTTSDDHTAIIWDVVTGKIIAKLKGHSGYVSTTKFSPDGSKVVTASDDHAAIIWDGHDFVISYTLKRSPDSFKFKELVWNGDGWKDIVDLATGEITSRSKIVEQILEVKVPIDQEDRSAEKKRGRPRKYNVERIPGKNTSDMVGKTGCQRQVRQGTHT